MASISRHVRRKQKQMLAPYEVKASKLAEEMEHHNTRFYQQECRAFLTEYLNRQWVEVAKEMKFQYAVKLLVDERKD